MGLPHLNQPSACPITSLRWATMHWVCAETWHSITLQQYTWSDLYRALVQEPRGWLHLQLQPGFTNTFNPMQEQSENLAPDIKNVLVREVELSPTWAWFESYLSCRVMGLAQTCCAGWNVGAWATTTSLAFLVTAEHQCWWCKAETCKSKAHLPSRQVIAGLAGGCSMGE